jgi:hypothetical protein
LDDDRRRALKKIIEVRSRERGGRSRRSIEEAVKIGELARIRFNLLFEVVEWDGKRRILRLKNE